ncbi:MAG: phosphatidylserine/phosphatidylglycerophosphate/cardiolipin synthase family protein [Lachnospiraceae bacterium]
MKKVFRIILNIFLVWAVYALFCGVILPLHHKTVETPQTIAQTNGSAACERILSIDNNQDALLWRLRMMEAAKKRIVLATFDLRDDQSGKDIMAALYHAADRGVRVQLLLDGMNADLHLQTSKNLKALASHKNVEIKLYNPINLLFPGDTNYRMHDKYVIVDDFAYLLGGRNTDDLFLGNYVTSYNEDRDILVYETQPGKGNSYTQLEDYFQKIWNYSCCKTYKKHSDDATFLKRHYKELHKRYPKAFTKTNWQTATEKADRIDLYTNPIEAENKQPLLWEQMVTDMKQGDRILIQTPYVICSKKMYQDLRDIASKSSKTELLINAVESGSNPFGCTDYLNQKQNIQKTGCFTYEYLGPQAQHTKTILIDDNLCYVGSCNADMRSVYLDTELMLRIESPDLNQNLMSQMETLKKKSRQVAPNGTITDGELYQPIEQDVKKKIIYGILRVIIVPLRHLL